MTNTEAKLQLSIVVPVYRGERTLEPLFSRIRESLDGRFTYEVIFVFDCGPDQSWSVIERIKTGHPDLVRAVKLSRNYGQHNAIICGIAQARGSFIVTMDEDLQQDPADIPRLLQTAQQTDVDVVYGNPEGREHAWWRNITSAMLKKLLRFAIPELPPYYAALRLIRRETALKLGEMQNSYTFLDGYLTWVTSSFAECRVAHHERFAGRSGYTFRKLIEHSINIFVTFSNLPIRLLMYIACTIFGLSTLYASWIVINKLNNTAYQAGFPTIVVILLMGFSLVLISAAILGEYLYRVNIKTTKKPNYCIQKLL